jgi:hypothetical protein
VAREGARGADDCGRREEGSLVARATGDITENKVPNSKVAGYIRRATGDVKRAAGEGAGRVGVAMVVSAETPGLRESLASSLLTAISFEMQEVSG